MSNRIVTMGLIIFLFWMVGSQRNRINEIEDRVETLIIILEEKVK